MSKAIYLKSIAIASSACVLLSIELPAWKLDFSPTKAVAVSQQMQSTAISLNAAELKQPQILSISTSRALTQVTGGIRLNGRLIKKLGRTPTRINLAPSLKTGKNTIAISGKYSPASSSVNVELIGPNNRVSQQMGGNGSIDQVLVIQVR
ncbi:hypothetical protein [Altericista sp. CCNU0014]|uniref:hypothetical protein n=1 Tax=Altericista sp. CCNU0014 TaxID=3082949 RepID=UPI00384F7A4A